MNNDQTVLNLEQAACTAQEEGDYNLAIQLRSQAIRLARQLERPRLLAVLLNRLGQVYDLNNNPSTAGLAFENGLKALANEPGLRLEAVLAEKRTARKGYSGPDDDFPLPDLYSPATASNLAEAEDDPALHLRLLINSGNSYLQRHQDEAAGKDYLLALQQPQMPDYPPLKAHALTHLGLIHYRQDEPDTALVYLNEALTLLEDTAGPLEKRRALATLGHIYRDQGKTALASQTYRQALNLYQQAGDTRGEARLQAGIGDLCLARQDYAPAETAFRRAIALAEPLNDRPTLWHASAGLGFCLTRLGQAEPAIAAFQRSLNLIGGYQQTLRTDEGKVSFLDSVQAIFDHLLMLYLGQGQIKAALELAEDARGRALLALMEGRQRRRRTPVPDRSGAALDASTASSLDIRQMATGLSSPGASGPELPAFNPAVQMAAGIEPQLQPLQPAINPPEATPAAPEPLPLARLVYHVMPEHTAIFAVSPEGDIQHHLAPWGEMQLAERVKRLRRALQSGQKSRGLFWGDEASPEADYRLLLREFYAALVAPLASYLPTTATPVVIEPHGPLWLLPFAALQAADGSWLADQWPLLYTPSAQALDDIRREPDYGNPANLRALIVGNPTMPALSRQAGPALNLNPLPGAEREAEIIAGLFPAERVRLLRGDEASRTTVEMLLPDYGIVHLATHGLADDADPLASFVALADSSQGGGALTARRVIQSLAVPADLVVLSACQTGLGKISGDGMIGLSRAFLVAGARAAVVSQWSVSDEATTALMTAFYRHYLKTDDKATALQQAMREVRHQPGFEHPGYWAPFVVVGAAA